MAKAGDSASRDKGMTSGTLEKAKGPTPEGYDNSGTPGYDGGTRQESW